MPDNLHPDALVRRSWILSVFPVSKSHWYDGIKSGRYPRPVISTGRISMWRRSDIEALLRARQELAPVQSPPTPKSVRPAPPPRPSVEQAPAEFAGLKGNQARAVAAFVIDLAFAEADRRHQYPDGQIERTVRRGRQVLAQGGPIPEYIQLWWENRAASFGHPEASEDEPPSH